MKAIVNESNINEQVNVLYIGGWGRSGSTLLTRMLAELDGFVAIGEVRDVFLRGLIENRVCGCGKRFSHCEFWQAVGDDAFGGWKNLEVDNIQRLRLLTDKPWHVPALLKPGLRSITDDALVRYSSLFSSIYKSVATISGASYIVDSSKIASYGAILQRTEGISPRIVHLVRDPRGTLSSWMKQVLMIDDLDKTRYMPRYNIASGAARYIGYNVEMHWVGRYGNHMLMRYEDLIAKPDNKIREILRFVGEDDRRDLAYFISDAGVKLGENHTIAGNPMRHDRGWIPLKQDNSWRKNMSFGKKFAITAMTFPMLKLYGYDAF